MNVPIVLLEVGMLALLGLQAWGLKKIFDLSVCVARLDERIKKLNDETPEDK